MLKPKTRRWIAIILVVLALLILAFFQLAPGIVAGQQNRVVAHDAYVIPGKAAELHRSLVIADLHADCLLWERDLRDRGTVGHADLPRLREGNMAIQFFTVVTSVPKGYGLSSTSGEVSDNVTALAMAQLWPWATWSSLFERALYQAKKLNRLAEQVPEEFQVIRNHYDLRNVLQHRREGYPVIAGILGTEGSHALEGQLENIDRLYDAGYRMMSLQHFFDNKLGGSLHGTTEDGLTAFGKAAVRRMEEKQIIIDVSHSSLNVVRDALAITRRPLIVTHTGVRGHCNTARNIPDTLMQQIAAGGGLIGIGFWRAAVCDITPTGIVRAIRYAIDLVGVNHVALGSDFDGAVTTSLDASELAVLTAEMLNQGFSEFEIRRVMGENVRDFLLTYLPEE